jgi:4-carboxymuconolactone decarboxylase
MTNRKGANRERYERGLKLFERLYGDAGANTLRLLHETAPYLADQIVEVVFGEMFSRPELDLKTRELATVAALTALGNAPKQLRGHIQGALNAGCSQQEILEVIAQMSAYAGFPAAINGLQAASEVFKKRGKRSRA